MSGVHCFLCIRKQRTPLIETSGYPPAQGFMCILQKRKPRMTRQELIVKRSAKLREHMELQGITSMTQLAQRVFPKKKDAGKSKQLERRLYACASTTKPQLIQHSNILLIAPLLKVQPSELFIEMTDKEMQVVGGTEPVKAPTSRPRKKRGAGRRIKATRVVTGTSAAPASAAKPTSEKKGLPVQFNCPLLGIGFQDYVTYDPDTQGFRGQHCTVSNVDGVPHLSLCMPISQAGASALLGLTLK